MRKRVDRTGEKQGQLEFIKFIKMNESQSVWEIKCHNCNKSFESTVGNIIQFDREKCPTCNMVVHSLSGHKLYARVKNILNRSEDGKKYIVSDELSTVKSFIHYIINNSDFQEAIDNKYTLCRIDPKLSWNKDNLCWKAPRLSTRVLSDIYPIVEKK